MVEDAGLTISALSCHGNPLHPDAAVAAHADDVFRRTVRLAEQLRVPVVVTFSGCPGDRDGARYPNWVTTPWRPEFLDVLDWQWEKKAIPYWRVAGRFAGDHGIKVAIEAHPGFLVYNTETALRLRAEAGQSVGVNFDPSHLFWQGVDMPTAIRAMGSGEAEWKRIATALRLAGYDYVISIEHEDALASVDEGLRAAVDMLHRVVLTEPPVTPWWT